MRARPFSLSLCFLTAALIVSGCSSVGKVSKSRYAMDDDVYAEKYEEGAEKGDIPGKLKQFFDARHVEGLDGLTGAAGLQIRDSGEPFFCGGEVSHEHYLTSWCSYNAGLAGYFGHGDWFAGLDASIQIQVPARISPYVGLGTFHGLSTTRVDADEDGTDNDDDGRIDEAGERRTAVDGWLSAIYPEVGAHLWLSGRKRLTGFGRYLISSEGRNGDDWFYGLQFSWFSR